MPVTWAGAARLRAKLKALNQRGVARSLNMSPSTLNKYAAGTRSPDPDTLIKLCRVLNVSADWLLGLREPEIADPESAQRAAARDADSGPLRREILGKLAVAEALLAEVRNAVAERNLNKT